MSRKTPQEKELTNEIGTWKPDVFYFPTQVDWELRDIQNNFLGKVLTLIDTLGLDPKREKATKDLIRTTVKEQMIKARHALDERLICVIRNGMEPLENTDTDVGSFFVKHHLVKPIYEDKDLTEDETL